MTICEPLHAPLAVQLVPLLDDQVTVAGCPTVTDAGLTFTRPRKGSWEWRFRYRPLQLPLQPPHPCKKMGIPTIPMTA